MSQIPTPQDSGQAYQMIIEQKGKNYSIAALVLGIAAIILAFMGPVGLIGLACGVVGLILGHKGRKMLPEGRRGMATAGFVCSIVGLAVAAIMGVLTLVAFMGLAALSTL